MSISEKLVLELQGIYENKTGIRLSFEDAQKCADDLVEAFDILRKIDQREKAELNK